VNIVIRADANHAIGVGHFTRCMSLARELKSSGHEVEFQSICEIPGLTQLAADNGLAITRINTDEPGSDPIFIDTGTQYDWSILDGYHFTTPSHNAANNIADHLLIIDDAPRNIEYPTTLVLDQNYGAENQQYPTPPEAQLLGTTYALIRPEITALRESSLSRSRRNTTSVVVMFGGSDPAGATGNVVEALAKITTNTLQVTVIAGPANTRTSELKQQCNDTGFNLLVNPPDLPDILSTSNLAISATGTTVWELMCLGVPVLSISIADNQIPAAIALEKDGLIEYFGQSSDLSAESLAQLITDKLANPDKLADMARRASEKVDGRGALRVVAAMTRLANGEQS
jgi:UDP-2,4-diacetamido-2,4,6-trideoxy-beta-L-altropyranose hydrolase